MKCDCCNSSNVVYALPYLEYQHIICLDCGFEKYFQPNSSIIANLYEDDSDYNDDLNVFHNPNDFMLWHHWEAIKYLKSHSLIPHIKILDVGCFNGFFVYSLLQLHCDAEGIDFNAKAIESGRELLGLGSRITTDTIEDLIQRNKIYDVITLFEVIEHLPDFNIILENISRLLKINGIIIVSTPNKNMCWRPRLDYPPHHLSRFTTESLSYLLRNFNMETIQIEEQMSVFEFVRHNIGSLFRSKRTASLRGGEIKNKFITNYLRRAMNKIRIIINIILKPVDKYFYKHGKRYISQIVIARKIV
jgi:2-polyprenyl-3-methyl-5-hydroxy-6-metoxy-1,4-benzoquinol methylase